MSSSQNLGNSFSNPFQTAHIRIVYQRRRLPSNYKLAYVFVSSRIYWRVANEDASNKPVSFLDFRNCDSLELLRLKRGTWNDVAKYTKTYRSEGRAIIMARGWLHGPERRNKLFTVRNVRIEIIPNSPEQHEFWFNIIRMLVAPWKLLQQEFRNIARSLPSSGVQKIRTVFDGLLTISAHSNESLMNMDIEGEKWTGIYGKYPRVLTILCVPRCLGVTRGPSVLSNALYGVQSLLEYVSQRTLENLNSLEGADEKEIEFVFKIFRVAVSTVDLAETQLMRGRARQIIHANDVKEVVTKLEKLKQMAIIAGTISKISLMGEVHHVRPSVSAFFSGRTRELDTLQDILREWGSAVITQYGGAGKTELMAAFADRAERDEIVPGGVFWVAADGNKRDLIASLAGLAEKLTRKKIVEQPRRNPNLVVAVLKQGLDEIVGRWLLCLDNADDSSVRGVLNEVCGIAGRTRGNGWVIVTSRQGRPYLWSNMMREQKLVLEPLCIEDAMVALWRQARKLSTDFADDKEVMRDIVKLKSTNPNEYRALEQLCDNERECSLGGLPLALVQAGIYMAESECSFSKYLKLFKNANGIEEMYGIMKKIEDLSTIKESRRSIWTTWTENVQNLTDKAYAVLRTIAMLGQSGVREDIVKRILEGVAKEGRGIWLIFQRVVIEELVEDSSLIWRDDAEREEQCAYRMHQLLRLFILKGMKRDSVEWNGLYSLALVTVHEVIRAELEKEGTSFEELPDEFGSNHHEFISHALALVNHHTLQEPDDVIDHGSKVEDIHRYSGLTMELLGNTEQEIRVWQRLLGILRHRQVSNRSSNFIGNPSDTEHGRNREGNEKSRIADVCNLLGLALMRNGSLSDAAHSFQQSLELRLEICGVGKPHPDIAISLNNLGSVYEVMGKLDEALEKYEQSLEMKRAIHGRNKPHPAIATSLNNLGNVYLQIGQLQKALEAHEESLEMKLAIHGLNEPHSDIATSLNNLGNVYLKMDQLENALENHEQSLELYRVIHGPDRPHPDIARALNNLGTVYQSMGVLDKALEMHKMSLEMELKIHGPDESHPDIATSLSNLGSVYQRMGKLEEALEKHKKSLKMKYAIHGENEPHPDIATSLNNIGRLYELIGELNKALEAHKQSLKMYRAIYGHKQHTAIATSLCNLGSVFQEMGRMSDALQRYDESLKMYRAIHGDDKAHSDIARLLNNIADVSLRQGNLRQAAELFEQSVAMLQTVYGAWLAHPEIALTLSNLGFVYQAQGNPGKALKTHEASLEIYRAIHGLDRPHLNLARSLQNIGLVCHELKILDRAAESYEQCLEMLRSVSGPHSLHPNIRAVLSNLADVYEAQGRRNQAAVTREQIAVTDIAMASSSSNSKSQT